MNSTGTLQPTVQLSDTSLNDKSNGESVTVEIAWNWQFPNLASQPSLGSCQASHPKCMLNRTAPGELSGN